MVLSLFRPSSIFPVTHGRPPFTLTLTSINMFGIKCAAVIAMLVAVTSAVDRKYLRAKKRERERETNKEEGNAMMKLAYFLR